MIKEPFFERSYDSDLDGPVMTRYPYYTLRVDQPSDIIRLRETDDRIPQKWRDEIPNSDDDSIAYRNRGNESFLNKQWAVAQVL
jgi:hypothetical protein